MMLRSLYWKIFLWFWLAMILLVVATAWSTRQVAGLSGLDGPRERQLVVATAALEEAAATLADGGPAPLQARLDGLQQRARARILVLDPTGAELLDRPFSRHLGRAERDGRVLGTPVEWNGEQWSVMVVLPPRMHPAAQQHREGGWLQRLAGGGPWELVWTRIAVAVMVSGLVCLLLARHLTGPLRRLRDASRALAGGDLQARVGPSIARRGDELGAVGRDFDTMAERMESLLLAQRRLLADVSHELRTPLARLVVALGLARRRAGDAPAPELDRMELEAERIDDLIGRILALQRMEQVSGDAGRRIDLCELAEEVIADARFEASAQGDAETPATVQLLHGEPAIVHGDATLLRAALENVVRNAQRYAPAGSVVEVSVRRSPTTPRTALVSVRDHGPGVSAADLPHLFEPFYRAAAARDRHSGGHGLGLAVTDRAVRLHGGRAIASNAGGGGLQVDLELPLAR